MGKITKTDFLVILYFFLIGIYLITIVEKEKFTSNLEPPIILKVNKKNTNAQVEWENKDKNIKEFVILYINVNDINNAVWVTNTIKCNKSKCKIILKNLVGKSYNLAILSKSNNKMSLIKNIVTFSDDKNYINLEDTAEVEKLSEINKIDTKNNIDLDNLEQIKKKYFAPDISQENTPSLSNSNLEEKSPSSSVNPHFDCSKKLNRVDIKNEGDLQNAQIKYNCKKDKEIDELYNIINEKPLYHKLWEIVF